MAAAQAGVLMASEKLRGSIKAGSRARSRAAETSGWLEKGLDLRKSKRRNIREDDQLMETKPLTCTKTNKLPLFYN